jgi:hypothetical protein
MTTLADIEHAGPAGEGVRRVSSSVAVFDLADRQSPLVDLVKVDPDRAIFTAKHSSGQSGADVPRAARVRLADQEKTDDEEP